MNSRKWSRTKEEVEVCDLCGTLCIPKNVGNVCIECIQAIPEHIPEEQTELYIRMKKIND